MNDSTRPTRPSVETRQADRNQAQAKHESDRPRHPRKKRG
jgi:hypothetical protein